MARGLLSRSDNRIRMPLQQGHRILGRRLGEQRNSQCGLLPRARVTVHAHFFRREAFLDSQSNRHGRNKLVGPAERPLSQREDSVEIIFLNPYARIRKLLKRNGTIRMSPCLVVSNMPILSPTPYRDVNGRRFNRGSDLLRGRW